MKYSTAGFWVVGVAIISMSLGLWCSGCSGKDQGKPKGKEMPMADPIYESGDWFSNNRLSFSIAGPLGHRFKSGDVWVRHFAVKDAAGSELPWESSFGDSLLGMMASFRIRAEKAKGPVYANGSLICWGVKYSITAEWREQGDGGPGDSDNVKPGDWKLVRNEIVRAEPE